jgi:hypothetical protein
LWRIRPAIQAAGRAARAAREAHAGPLPPRRTTRRAYTAGTRWRDGSWPLVELARVGQEALIMPVAIIPAAF